MYAFPLLIFLFLSIFDRSVYITVSSYNVFFQFVIFNFVVFIVILLNYHYLSPHLAHIYQIIYRIVEDILF